MNKKGWKTAEKNVSTSFQVLQAPESWSKYTTPPSCEAPREPTMYVQPTGNGSLDVFTGLLEVLALLLAANMVEVEQSFNFGSLGRVSISKFSRRGRKAANKISFNLPSWQCGRLAATP